MGTDQLSPQLMNKLVYTVLVHGLNDHQTAHALQILTDALTHENDAIRELAIVAIADLPIPTGKRVHLLNSALQDPQAKVRRRAARALADQGTAAQTALPQLIVGLQDMDASVRRDCAGAISRLGPSAHSAAAHLLTLLGEPDPRTRAVVIVALKRIGRGSIPALLKALNAPDAVIRAHAALLLGKLAPSDAYVAGLLRPLLADVDADVRSNTEFALSVCLTTTNGPATVIRNELPAIV
ncbi:MAG: HEAT repeat domain-containing protein [Bacteroidales bacterium]|nr:HEAT repeat domain-containing protein [Bacteroidales bacterium]